MDQTTETLVEAKVEVCLTGLSIDNCIHISRARESSGTQGAASSRSMSLYEHGNPVVCELLQLAASCVIGRQEPLVFLSSETYRLIQSIPIDKYSRRL